MAIMGGRLLLQLRCLVQTVALRDELVDHLHPLFEDRRGRGIALFVSTVVLCHLRRRALCDLVGFGWCCGYEYIRSNIFGPIVTCETQRWIQPGNCRVFCP